MGGRVIVCPASMSDWRYMKQIIYKVFKVSIIVALVALILLFIVNRIPGGKSLINNTKEKLSDIHDKTDDEADMQAKENVIANYPYIYSICRTYDIRTYRCVRGS